MFKNLLQVLVTKSYLAFDYKTHTFGLEKKMHLVGEWFSCGMSSVTFLIMLPCFPNFFFTEQQSNFAQTQAGPGYPSQSGHAYQQAGYVPSKSPVKYSPGQSAFSSYSNPYAHQQTKQLQESGYPAYRMAQPGFYKMFCILKFMHVLSNAERSEKNSQHLNFILI